MSEQEKYIYAVFVPKLYINLFLMEQELYCEWVNAILFLSVPQ